MEYKYGEFSQNQMAATKAKLRKQIFYLLLYKDRKTANEYKNVDVVKAFENELHVIGGMNKLLGEPQELVTVMSLLESAYFELKSENFTWGKYRKLILDAGNMVLKIKEV